MVVFLLRLKSCSRFTWIRRAISGAVTGFNPTAKKKFRGRKGFSENEFSPCAR